AVRTRALHQGGLSVGIPSGYLAFEHIAARDALVTQWRGQGPVDLPGRYRGQRRCGTLTLCIAECSLPRSEPGADAKDRGAALAHILLTDCHRPQQAHDVPTGYERDSDGTDVLLAGVLTGALVVLAGLSRAIPASATVAWVAVPSYGPATQSSGVVRILKD